MKRDAESAKEKIYQATLELLAGGAEAERITTRQIASAAGVNPALVNYYYRSKENLLSEVVAKMMEGIIALILSDVGEDAESRLRDIMTATADAAFAQQNICKIALAAELKRGCRNSCAMVMPLLRDIFTRYGEAELNIIALQLMLPFHHIGLEPELYGGITNTDFFDKPQRDKKINEMISCILKGV